MEGLKDFNMPSISTRLDNILAEIVETRRRMRKIESLLDISIFKEKKPVFFQENDMTLYLKRMFNKIQFFSFLFLTSFASLV